MAVAIPLPSIIQLNIHAFHFRMVPVENALSDPQPTGKSFSMGNDYISDVAGFVERRVKAWSSPSRIPEFFVELCHELLKVFIGITCFRMISIGCGYLFYNVFREQRCMIIFLIDCAGVFFETCVDAISYTAQIVRRNRSR